MVITSDVRQKSNTALLHTPNWKMTHDSRNKDTSCNNVTVSSNQSQDALYAQSIIVMCMQTNILTRWIILKS